MSQIIQQVPLIRMQSKQDMLILEEQNNLSNSFGLNEDEKFLFEEQDIEEDYGNSINKNLDTKNYTRNSLSKHMSLDGLLVNNLLSSLRKFKFSEQKFYVSKLLSNIKYHSPGTQNNNLFHLFNNQ